jgi:hypothetical protein
MTEPKDKRGLTSVAGGTFDAGGLGRHSTDDLMRIFCRQDPLGRIPPGAGCV